MIQGLYSDDPGRSAPNNEIRGKPPSDTPHWGYLLLTEICYDGFLPLFRPSIKDLAFFIPPEDCDIALQMYRFKQKQPQQEKQTQNTMEGCGGASSFTRNSSSKTDYEYVLYFGDIKI